MNFKRKPKWYMANEEDSAEDDMESEGDDFTQDLEDLKNLLRELLAACRKLSGQLETQAPSTFKMT